MTLLNRIAAALASAVVTLSATAAPIEIPLADLEHAATREEAQLTAVFEEDNVRLKREGDTDLDAPQVAADQSDANVVSVPEPDHYKLLLIGGMLLLLAGARRRRPSPWNSIKVSQQPD